MPTAKPARPRTAHKAASKKPENTGGNKRKPLPEAFVARQWKAGESGNPGGRPKKKPITQMFEEMLSDEGDYRDIKAAIKKVFFEKSGMAKVLLLREAAERVEGKVSQSIEHSGEIALSIGERLRKGLERKASA